MVVILLLWGYFFITVGRNITNTAVTKSSVLEKVSQITIFSYYLGIDENVIKDCIDNNVLICSPLRDDTHPTAGFRYDSRGKLKFKDFNGSFWGDCFDVVAAIMSVMYNKPFDVSNKQDFIKILKHIMITFKDIFYGKEKDINLINGINAAVQVIKHNKPIIELVVRKWNDYDVRYWSQFGVKLEDLNINFIYAVEQYYINRKVNPQPKYYYDVKDPCYAYYLGKDKNGINNFKLYFPRRKHGSTRFITNCNHLEGIHNLDRSDYDVIVITKSTKDRVSIRAAVNEWILYGGVNGNQKQSIGVIAIPHETYRLRSNEFDWIKSKLNIDGKIVSLMDNDIVGIKEAIWLKDTYDIIPVLIPKRYKSKDFAELASSCNRKQLMEAIQECKIYIDNYHDKKDTAPIDWGQNDFIPF